MFIFFCEYKNFSGINAQECNCWVSWKLHSFFWQTAKLFSGVAIKCLIPMSNFSTFHQYLALLLFLILGMRLRSGFIFPWMSSCSNTTCWKGYLSSIELLCITVKNQSDIFLWVYFWHVYSVSFIFVSISALITHCLNLWLLYLYSRPQHQVKIVSLL